MQATPTLMKNYLPWDKYLSRIENFQCSFIKKWNGTIWKTSDDNKSFALSKDYLVPMNKQKKKEKEKAFTTRSPLIVSSIGIFQS